MPGWKENISPLWWNRKVNQDNGKYAAEKIIWVLGSLELGHTHLGKNGYWVQQMPSHCSKAVTSDSQEVQA